MVSQIEKILFATDLSEDSRRAFRYAVSMAERYQAEIVLLHVIQEVPHGAKQMISFVLGEETWRQVNEARERHARNLLIGKKTEHLVIRKALADFYGASQTDEQTRAFEDLEIDIRDGQVAEEIVAAAEEHHCQVIVMGVPGKRGGGASLGSAITGVLSRANTPVFVVPPPKQY